jgi:hypothetical protein
MSGERTATKSEEELIEKGKKLAASYLTQRDGLDEDLARQIVDGMSPEDVHALIVEANVSVPPLPATDPEPPAPAPAAASANPAVPDQSKDDEKKEYPDYLTIPALAEFADNGTTFQQLVARCVTEARIKNKAEATYKATKQVVMRAMVAAGSLLTAVDGVKLEKYVGKTVPQLDPLKLLEKGVSIDIINACWTSKDYDDVRITYPKGGN